MPIRHDPEMPWFSPSSGTSPGRGWDPKPREPFASETRYWTWFMHGAFETNVCKRVSLN